MTEVVTRWRDTIPQHLISSLENLKHDLFTIYSDTIAKLAWKLNVTVIVDGLAYNLALPAIQDETQFDDDDEMKQQEEHQYIHEVALKKGDKVRCRWQHVGHDGKKRWCSVILTQSYCQIIFSDQSSYESYQTDHFEDAIKGVSSRIMAHLFPTLPSSHTSS